MNKLALPLALTLLLAACGDTPLLQSKKIEYKSAVTLPTLEVPPDLTAPEKNDQYSIPAAGKDGATYSAYAAGRKSAGAAESGGVLPQGVKMKIERAGSERWLVAPGTPAQLWPRLKSFWQSVGLPIVKENPEAGTMETEWAENRARLPQGIIRETLGKVFDSLYSTPERDKYRTRVERGADADTTEIYISHRGMYEIYTNEGRTETRWQPRPADTDLEAEMLQRLMVSLGETEDKARVAVAQPKQAEQAALTTAPDGQGRLEVSDPFDRAWRRVGLALDRVGFTVEDRNRAQGIYFVRYVDPEADGAKKDEGFLAKLAFWRDKPGADKFDKYRIEVKAQGGTSVIRVLNDAGAADTSATAKKILGLLQEQLK